MRLFLRATRAIISAATSLHIATLRGSVYLNDRLVAKAMNATDAAKATLTRARADVALADNDHAAARAAEAAVCKANTAFRKAAQADANSYRRGTFI